MIRELTIITAAIYAVWTPFYFLAKPEPVIPPEGGRVELILPTGSLDETGRIVSRGFGFKQRDNEVETANFVVYEDSKPLPSDYYELAPFNAKNKWRDVKFRTSDDSDPRYNGRRYYAVVPRR